MGTRTQISTYAGDGIAIIDTDASFSKNWKTSRGPSDIISVPSEHVWFNGTLCTTALAVSASTWINTEGFDYMRVFVNSPGQNASMITTYRMFSGISFTTIDDRLTAPTTMPTTSRGTYTILTSESSATALYTNITYKSTGDLFDIRGTNFIAATIENNAASESSTVDFTLLMTFTRII